MCPICSRLLCSTDGESRLPGPALLQGLPDLPRDLGPDGDARELLYVFCRKAECPTAISAFISVLFSLLPLLCLPACLHISLLPIPAPHRALCPAQSCTPSCQHSPLCAGSSATPAVPLGAGATRLDGGTPREVWVNAQTLASHGALVQPCKPWCDALSAPIARAGTPGVWRCLVEAPCVPLGGGGLGLKEGPCHFGDALRRSVLFGPSKVEVR